MLSVGDVRKVDLGYFVRPADETDTGVPRVEPVLGYLVRLSGGLLLFDTGMGVGPAELDAHYRPVRAALPQALARVGHAVDEITHVVNCHLHFDHCGGNPLLPNRPIFVQRRELSMARGDAYTLPDLVDFPDATYECLDGEAEIETGIFIVPTPGHTEGHHSLVVRCDDGTVVLAGQARDFASEYAADVLARRADREGMAQPLPGFAGWLARLDDLDPARVLFAHDHAVWESVRWSGG
jgi:glyoxylase-like metal-dependent hydrolase (beta-lactamase superfamily II)